MKKKNTGILAGLTAMYSKVFATQMVYGPPQPNMSELILSVFQVLIAPILFLIGTMVYLKKSKGSKNRKIITVIIFILLLVGICLGLETMMDDMYIVAS